MIQEELKKEFSLNEKISNVILIFLLLVRLADQDLAIWLFGANTPIWFSYWYFGIAYILTAIIVLLNRHRLGALNIDRPFMVALILGGVFSAFGLTFNNIGVSVGITAGLIYWAYTNNNFIFKNPIPYPKITLLLILLSILLALVPILIFHAKLQIPITLHILTTIFWMTLTTQLTGIVFEEVIFRGALWAYLRNLGFSEQVTFFVQAILFWISHHRYLSQNSPYSFWVALPIATVLFGLLAWRSKSLTPSLIAHFLSNFISQLLRAVY